MRCPNGGKPGRQVLFTDVFAKLAIELPAIHEQTLLGLSNALTRLWGRDAMIAGFQKRSLSALSHAWNGDGADAFAVAADTGSGKTEAAALPLIAGAAADRLQGTMGVRAILAYPRIRLAANQAQRLAHYLEIGRAHV